MKVQENQTTKQKFINLPMELCKALEIKQGMDIEFKIINKRLLEMKLVD